MCDPMICWANPDLCDPMPGWEVTWNPPACTADSPDAAAQLAAPFCGPEVMSRSPRRPANAPTEPGTDALACLQQLPQGPHKPVRASPGHVTAACHAVVLGAASAMLMGRDFESESLAAVQAVRCVRSSRSVFAHTRQLSRGLPIPVWTGSLGDQHFCMYICMYTGTASLRQQPLVGHK